MVTRHEFVLVEICKSHVNPDTNPYIGVIRDGELSNMIAIFDKHDVKSRGLELGKVVKAQVLHVLPKCLIVRFDAYIVPSLPEIVN